MFNKKTKLLSSQYTYVVIPESKQIPPFVTSYYNIRKYIETCDIRKFKSLNEALKYIQGKR